MAPLYSVIIPAYNEEQWLPATLAALREAMAGVTPPGEVIVVDNNSSDRTAEIARQHGARVVFEPVNQISRARNAGARAAEGKYLVFLDADTSVPAGLLNEVLARLGGGKCCGGGALVDHDAPLPWFARWLAPVWNALAPRVGLAAGCFIFCLREAFEGSGGFSENVYASEEIWFSQGLKRWGAARKMRFEVIAAPRVLTSARKLQDRPVRNFLSFCFVLAFPLAVRSKRLCGLWYYRQGK